MPHNIYLHSALCQGRLINRQDPGHIRQANKYSFVDSFIALFISLLINVALVASFAHGFHTEECAHHDDGPFACIPGAKGGDLACKVPSGLAGTCGAIGLNQGGRALQALFEDHKGKLGQFMFSLGVLAAGQASTMTGTFAGQYVVEGFLEVKMPVWVRTLFTRCVALGPAVAVAVLAADKEELNSTVSQWLNVLQSMQLPFALIPILHFTSHPYFMGPFATGKCWKRVCAVIVVIVLAVNFIFVVILLEGNAWWVWLLASSVGVLYFLFIFLLVRAGLNCPLKNEA